ncbi:MAG: hypothetical protein WBC44_03120 [Planctomycetaceae bacterium]
MRRPDDQPVTRWLAGLAVPLAVLIYSTVCVIRERTLIVGRRPLRLVEFHGAEAVALAALYASLGLLAHAHWFWGDHPDFAGYAEVAKIVLVGMLVVSCGWLSYLVVLA